MDPATEPCPVEHDSRDDDLPQRRRRPAPSSSDDDESHPCDDAVMSDRNEGSMPTDGSPRIASAVRASGQEADDNADGAENSAKNEFEDVGTSKLRGDAVPGYTFEYLDHTADIQIHSWGRGMEEAFAAAALGMYNYMTPLDGIAANQERSFEVSSQAHDLQSLLFAFLDELLFVFQTELFVCTRLEVMAIDRESWALTARGWGDTFVRGQHESGTEVKAITYSAMQILEREDDSEIFVIVDI